MTVVVRTHGGLGNQLFQVLYGRLYAATRNARFFEVHDRRYAHAFVRSSELMAAPPPPPFMRWISSLRLPKIATKLGWPHSAISIGGVTFLDGYFQSLADYRAFDDALVRDELCRLGAELGVTRGAGEGRAVHLRLGDFFTSETAIDDHLQSRLGRIEAGTVIVTNEEHRLAAPAIAKSLATAGASVVPTGDMSAEGVLRTLASFAHVDGNGSTLLFWASVLSGMETSHASAELSALSNYFRSLMSKVDNSNCGTKPAVNILSRHDAALFSQHFDADRDGFEVVENGTPDRDWDLLIVFEALAAAAAYRVREGGRVFIAGEPPAVGRHGRRFLQQFDSVFCAGAPLNAAPQVSREQHFNNWHFGLSAGAGYRYDHRFLVEMPPPEKFQTLSTITSNLNYLPMHIKRFALVNRLARDYGSAIDIFGRPHRYIEYKDDAILPYRFHLCIENCAVPGLWTEKIADALLGYAVPVYVGCPDIETYFPGATITINLDDYASARRTIDAILADGASIYQQRLDAVVAARRRLIEDYDISALVRNQLDRVCAKEFRQVVIAPVDQFAFARAQDLLSRACRKVTAVAWRGRMALRNKAARRG